MKYNVLSGDVIINTILAPSLEVAEAVSGAKCIEQQGEIGWVWNEAEEAFAPPRPYPSWIWDKGSRSFVPPVEMPESDIEMVWDEDTQNWVAATLLNELPAEDAPVEEAPIA